MNIFPNPTGNPAAGAYAHRRIRPRPPATYAMIQRRVAGLTGVALEHLDWPERGRTAHMEARHLAFYLAATEAALSPSILATVTGRKRQTIAHALQRIEHRREADAAFDRGVDLAAALVQQDLASIGADNASQAPSDVWSAS